VPKGQEIIFSLLLNIQTRSGAHTAFYTMNTGGSFPRVQGLDHKAHLTTHLYLVPTLRMSGETALRPSAFKACAQGRHISSPVSLPHGKCRLCTMHARITHALQQNLTLHINELKCLPFNMQHLTAYKHQRFRTLLSFFAIYVSWGTMLCCCVRQWQTVPEDLNRQLRKQFK
jgi:hypothetical protein